MNDENAHTPTLLDQVIATLLAVFGAPVQFALRVLERRAVVKARFARILEICEENGWALRRDGEDDATVEARIRFLAWIADDPWAAGKYLARQLRGWEAHRHAHYVPVLCLPPCVMARAPASACGFDLLLPDTS